MSENHKNNHEIVGGDVARVFVCKPYGREFTAIRSMVLIFCMKNPTRGSKYVLTR